MEHPPLLLAEAGDAAPGGTSERWIRHTRLPISGLALPAFECQAIRFRRAARQEDAVALNVEFATIPGRCGWGDVAGLRGRS
jgi:hypothetical protein